MGRVILENNNNQAFIKGTVILLTANIITKLFGMLFKIPLTYLIGEEGMGIFSTAYTMYSFMFIIATAGLPVAVSKMVSESESLKNTDESRQILKVSATVLTIIGVLGSAFLFFGAEFLANAINCPVAASSIRAVSPAIFFVGVMSAFRGFFQGHQDMIPTAFSEVTESVGKLIFGYGLSYWFLTSAAVPLKMQMGAAGAVLGVSVGTFLACGVIIAMFFKRKKTLFKYSKEKCTRKKSEIAKTLLIIAIPITLGASVFSLTSIIDMAMIMRRLQVAGFDHIKSTALYGSYTGYAVPLFNMPPTLISSISISIVPAIASAYVEKNKDLVKKTTLLAIKVTTIFALPCAVGIAILAEPILNLVYKNASSAKSLSILGYAIVFVSLVMVTNAILQAMRKERIPVINMAIGGVFKIVINYILVAVPGININGAPVGTICCYVIILSLNLCFIIKEMRIGFNISEFIVKPVICVAVMAVGVLFVNRLTSSMHYAISVLLSIGAGAIVYFIMIFALKTVNYDDILMVPKGEKIADIMVKFKIINK